MSLRRPAKDQPENFEFNSKLVGAGDISFTHQELKFPSNA